MLVTDLLVGTLGFVLLENYTFIEALYMTLITVSTVGFTEVHPLSTSGQLFTSVLILANIGIFAYALAVFSYYVIQGEVFKKMHLNMINSSIKKLQGHIILCGFGRYGQEIATHFNQHGIPFVVIETDEQKVELIQHSENKTLYLQEDATRDEALLEAGIERANALISALGDDSDNVFAVLTARQLNPKLNIISRAKDLRSRKKLRMAGADHVVMPEQIGGFYMATLVSKPGAVEFFSFITNEHRSDIGFEEVAYEDMPDYCRDNSLRDLDIREQTGVNIVGYKAPDSTYEVNPDPDTQLSPGASFIVLGSHEQLGKLRTYMERPDE